MIPILSSIFPSRAMKITNTTNDIDVLIPIQVVRVNITLPSKAMYHQMENGESKVDQRVLMPIQIQIELISPGQDIVEQVNSVLMDRESLYSIETRGLIFNDLRANHQDLEQSAQMLSATPTRLTFLQLLYQNQENAVSAQASDSSVIDRGIAIVNQAQDTLTGISTKISKTFGSIF